MSYTRQQSLQNFALLNQQQTAVPQSLTPQKMPVQGGTAPTDPKYQPGYKQEPTTTGTGGQTSNTQVIQSPRITSQATNAFDEQRYLAENPDVAEAVANGTLKSGLEHFLQHGKQEGRLGTYTQTKSVGDMNSDMINNPSLPAAGTFKSAKITPNSNEFIDAGNYGIGGGVGEVGSVSRAGTAQADLAQADQSKIDPFMDQSKGQYDAATIGDNTPQATAATQELDKRATVQFQYEQLMDFPPGEVPLWAKGAVRVAESRLAAVGMGASTHAGEAITAALAQAALPIAQQDAQAYAAIQQQNLNNEQQTVLANQAARVQTMLSDQAATNAARQFNAASAQQFQQFFANLVSQIDSFNVEQFNATSQFNAGERNTQERFNAEQVNTVNMFNAKQALEREKFNTEMAAQIEQSNVQWRRDINTANTASQNAENQINAQNALNISNTAMANLWQQWRDEATWAFQANENELARAHALALAAFDRDTTFALYDAQQDADLWGAAISTAVDLVFG